MLGWAVLSVQSDARRSSVQFILGGTFVCRRVTEVRAVLCEVHSGKHGKDGF